MLSSSGEELFGGLENRVTVAQANLENETYELCPKDGQARTGQRALKGGIPRYVRSGCRNSTDALTAAFVDGSEGRGSGENV